MDSVVDVPRLMRRTVAFMANEWQKWRMVCDGFLRSHVKGEQTSKTSSQPPVVEK